MAEGLSSAAANSALDAHVAAYPWVQLHTAAPGAAGTTAVAGNATRKQVTWAAAASGSVANSASVSWSDAEVDTAETYTHYTLWDASTAGNFGSSGSVTANAVQASGDSVQAAVGAFSLSFTVAS